MTRFGTGRHLAKRFVGMLDPRGPSLGDEGWVRAHLGPGELALWAQMSGPDRRHAVEVARRALAALPGEEPSAEVVAAALLHDVGKIAARLGPVGRVAATVAGLLAPRASASGDGRIARYLTHDRRGAAMLRAAGASPLTVRWAAEHHQAAERWTVPASVGAALKAADDD